MKNQSKYGRVMLSVGLLMVILPMLLKEYVHIPDFARGFLMGAGLIFEIAGLVLMNRKPKSGEASCL